MTRLWIDVEVQLWLDDAGCDPDVKLWIDLEPEAALSSEAVLPLQRRGARWTGAFIVGDRAGDEFLYRVGIAAHEGARFRLSIRERRAQRVLLDDGDMLCFAKCMLVGSCASVARTVQLPTRPPPKLHVVRLRREIEQAAESP